MTMHIDERLLARVMKSYGFASKTEAVDASLREMNRRSRLHDLRKKGLGFTAEELRRSVDKEYDVVASRMVAESRERYGHRSGR